MDAGSVLSEPASSPYRPPSSHPNTPIDRSQSSMTLLSTSSSNKKATPQKMSQLESLEAKMASIEVSLSTSAPSRRRKGTSLGSASIRSASKPEPLPSKELISALAEREAVIQNLRKQLGLAQLPRPSGPAFDEADLPAAQQRLTRLKADAENKKIAIRNLKAALDKLDITDNIDSRIRQAELEYALGREELHLLSLVEEAQALQARLDKSKPESNTLFNILESGTNLSLIAVRATPGRWNACLKTDIPGFWVEWALEGENLCRGDRIIEVNGKILASKSREELQQLMNHTEKCELVVIRKKPVQMSQHQLQQYQADNIRLQHRISYLEEQVNELQSAKEKSPDSSHATSTKTNGTHITSISISSPPSTPPEDKPQIYQRGSYVTTIIGGTKTSPDAAPPTIKPHVTTTAVIKDPEKRISAKMISRPMSASSISIHSDIHAAQRREREREREYRRQEREKYGGRAHSHARSVEYLNHFNGMEKRRVPIEPPQTVKKNGIDFRSMRSLDFNNDESVDYTSEPVAARIRPTPPKKPLRLSLHRAQSLQTVDGALAYEQEKKRALKRPHRTERSIPELTSQFIENNLPLQTASLGRQRYV